MFINLSNHPSKNWGDEQKEAAENFPNRNLWGGATHEIVDIPFPNISPALKTEEVFELAKKIMIKILELVQQKGKLKPFNVIIHLMGEQSFCVALLDLIRYHTDFRVVVSTTERETVINADGSKTAKFNFVQFREV